MQSVQPFPASILGGDPFNQFRFLYRRELLWKLFDEDYCLSVMKACYEAGGTAFDLSFEVNTRLFRRLLDETGANLIGVGNPSWEQGFLLNGRHIQYSRDRIIRTLVDRYFPRELAEKVDKELSIQDVLVFGYDRNTAPLSDEEVASIHLDKDLFLKRISIFKDCQYLFLGGSDADWLVSLGRTDLINEMVAITREKGYIPYILCQYASHIVPIMEQHCPGIEGYVLPLNKDWSWFDRDSCLQAIQPLKKPVVAFMPLASGSLRKDVRGALDWLFVNAKVESILFGTADPEHAIETTRIASESRNAAWHQDKE
jgi:hypothetical protein